MRELSRAVELRPDHPRALVSARRRLRASRRRERRHRGARARGDGAARGRRSPGFAEAQLALATCIAGAATTTRPPTPIARRSTPASATRRMRAEIYRGLGASICASDGYDKAVRELRKAVAATARRRRDAGPARARALPDAAIYDTARVCLERAAQAARPDPLGAGVARRSVRAARPARRRARRLSSARSRAERRPRCRSRRGWAWRGWRWRAGDAQAAAHRGAARARARSGAARHPDDARAHLAAAQQWDDALAAYDRALVPAPAAAGSAGSCCCSIARGLLEEALRAALRAGLRRRAPAATRRRCSPTCPSIPTRWPRRRAPRPTAASSSARSRSSSARSPPATRVEARLAAADVALRRGQPTPAAAALRRAAQLAPDDPRPRARLAEVYRDRARRGAGARSLRAVVAARIACFARTPRAGRARARGGRASSRCSIARCW